MEEVAKGLTDLCQAGDFQASVEKYYAPNIVSVEAMGRDPVCEGLPAIIGKTQWFVENVDVHGLEVVGPFGNGNTCTFAVGFTLESTVKQKGERTTMREVAVSKVEDGKIVHEQFIMYAG